MAEPAGSLFELSADCATYRVVAALELLDNRSEVHQSVVFESTKESGTGMSDIPSPPDQQVVELALDAEQRLLLVGEGAESHSHYESAPSYVVALFVDPGRGQY